MNHNYLFITPPWLHKATVFQIQHPQVFTTKIFSELLMTSEPNLLRWVLHASDIWDTVNVAVKLHSDDNTQIKTLTRAVSNPMPNKVSCPWTTALNNVWIRWSFALLNFITTVWRFEIISIWIGQKTQIPWPLTFTTKLQCILDEALQPYYDHKSGDGWTFNLGGCVCLCRHSNPIKAQLQSWWSVFTAFDDQRETWNQISRSRLKCLLSVWKIEYVWSKLTCTARRQKTSLFITKWNYQINPFSSPSG